MKRNISMLFAALIAVGLFAVPLYAKQELSANEIKQIEGKIRQDFQQQQAYVNSSLLKIGNELDQFLFGPETTGRLLQFFNKKIKPGNITDKELLWKEFKNDVINKERFDQFIDELIEVHFRVFDKARGEVNRDLVMYGLDGVSEVNYDAIKKQLKEAIDKIWNMEEAKIREFIEGTAKHVYEANWYKDIDLYVDFASLIPIAGIVIWGGWNMFKYFTIKESSENLLVTGEQQFMKDMTKTLESLSEKTKEEFRIASELAVNRLFGAIRDMVVTAYPQISRENLQ
ncbi:MAG: hypothetical protein AB7S75_08335 [Desulfococcaceae bacterium]